MLSTGGYWEMAMQLSDERDAPDFRRARANEAFQQGRTIYALTALRELNAEYPDDAQGAAALGNALCNEREFAEAIEPLSRAANLRADDCVSRAYLAIALLLGRFDVSAAYEEMERAVDCDPASFIVRWKEGE